MIPSPRQGLHQSTVQNKENLVERADRERERSNFKKALYLYNKAREYGSSLNIDLGIAHTLRIMGDFEGALRFYDRICKKYKNRTVLADAMVGKALSLKGLSRTGEAVKILKRAEKIYEELDDEMGFAYLNWAYCVVFRISGNFKEAMEYGERALAIFNYFEDKKGILYSSCALGGLSRILGNLEDSLNYYKKANEIAGELKDKFGIAYSYCGLGNYYRMNLNFKKAMENFKKAEEIYREIGDIVSFSYTLWSMGILMTLKGRFKEAFRYFEESLSNFEKTRDRRGVLYSLMGLIQLNFLEGKSIDEERKKAKEILRKFKLPWEELLFDILISKVEGKEKSFDKKVLSFGASYKFEKFPLNLP